MRKTIIFLIYPLLSFAQPMQWQPQGIPVEENGRIIPIPWSGGLCDSKPEFVDIDGDGDYDVFIGDNSGKLWFFENIGDSLNPEWEYISDFYDSIDIGYWCKPSFCDIDNDQDYDLFVSGAPNFDIWFYRNIGSSTNPIFEFVTDSLTGVLWCGTSNFIDIDYDNDYDIIIGGPSGYIEYYQNIGDSQQYAYTIEDTIYDVGTYAVPHLKDIDDDEDYDLVVGNESGGIWYLCNDGTLYQYDFTLVTSSLVPVSAPDAAPTLADLDGDGDLDLFVGTGQAGIYTPFGGIRFYENTGTPEVYNYQLITDNYFCIDCGWKTTPRLIDIDADGDLDLFVGYSSGGIAFFRNTGTVEAPYFILEEEWFQQLSGGSHCSPDFADLDGDGDYDLLIGYEDINSQAKVKYFENIGSPETPIFVLISTDYLPGLPDLSARPASCDIDFDGDIDIFVSTWYVEGVFFYCNIGTPISPRFQLESQNYQDLPTGNLYFWDLDGDTDYDLFMGYGTNIRYYENIGSPYGANFELISENWENLNIHSPYAYPCISDIDNDSDGDLFIGSEDGGVVFYRNQYYNNSISNNYINNPKTFILQQPYPNPFNPSTTLCFTLDEASPVKLSVYNQLGQEVTTIINNQMSPGSYRFNWDASNYSSGVYLISLESNLGIQQTQKVILVK